jgi:IS1 family transposase
MRLGVKVGEGCTALMDAKMRNLSCQRLEMDEIWGFVGKKDRNVKTGDSMEIGSVWTFCAIDADTKLVPAFKVGERNPATTQAFVQDVSERIANRVQISTDGLKSYIAAIDKAFGTEVDYARSSRSTATNKSTIAVIALRVSLPPRNSSIRAIRTKTSSRLAMSNG